MDSLAVPTPPSPPTSPLSPDEEKLLAKLEEQNRLLETDSKSLCSVHGVLRSPHSLKIFSFEEDCSNWAVVVENWDEWSKKKVKLLKEMIRKGIHPHFRPKLWQMLCKGHSLSIQEQYSELLKKVCPCEKLIQRDLSKILPQHLLFQGLHSSIQQQICNVLKAYAVLDREVGYNQATVFIVGLLLIEMTEEEAFGVFLRLMQDFRLRELYRPQMVELGCCMFQLEEIIQEQLPELYSHFQVHAFHASTFSSSWFLTVFLSCLPLTAAKRVFDIFLSEGLEVVFRVGMAILQVTQTELMKLDMEGMLQFLGTTAPQLMDRDPDKMITTAYQMTFDSKKMKKLEKEYMSVKMKELEEQEEIQRLHSENKVLRQRIETLEKRHCEDAVEQLGQDCVQVRLRQAEHQRLLKQMEIKMLLMDKSSTVPDQTSVMSLHEQLLSGKMREAETLAGLREIKRHIKDLEEQWQKQQKGSTVSDLQGDLMSMSFREIHSRVQLTESRHRLLQQYTQDQIYSLQLKRITESMVTHNEHLQELMKQNQHLCSLLRPTTEEQQREVEVRDCEDDTATVTKLQDQITQLKTQIKMLSSQKEVTRL